MESAKIYSLNVNRFNGSAAVGTPPALPKPKLLDQVRQAIHTRHYSDRTEKAYAHWIKRYIFFHKQTSSTGNGGGRNLSVSFRSRNGRASECLYAEPSIERTAISLSRGAEQEDRTR